MAADEFNLLATKMLADEATPEERARLEAVLAAEADRAAEFAELQAVWLALREVGPLAQAMEAPPLPIPEPRLKKLRQVVREEFPAIRPAQPSEPRSSRREEAHSGSVEETQRRLTSAATLGGGKFGLRLALAAILIGGLLLAGIWCLWLSPRSNSSSPAGYLVITKGTVELRRAAQTLPLSPAAPVHAADELRLTAGSQAEIIAANGVIHLQGPKQLRVQAAIAGAVRTIANVPNDTAATERAQQRAKIQTALFRPVPQLAAGNLLITSRAAQSIPLYSPAGATARLAPPIWWKAEPGKTYDLVISDELNKQTPPFRANALAPPVDFAKLASAQGKTLAKDGLYRLRLTESGRSASVCEYVFRTLPASDETRPATPGEKLLAAHRIYASDASRVGDVLAELLTLPDALANTELALRLKLLAFGQLGYAEDFDAALAKLKEIAAER